RAVHTSFEGDVELAFRAPVAGQPPIAGVLHHAALDVRPLSRPSDARLAREGQRVLAFWGIHPAPPPYDTGLAVDRVDPRSRAEAAGIAAGDVIARVDHVRIAGLEDVVPAPGKGEATVLVRRPSAGEERLQTLPVSGFEAATPAALGGSVLLVAAALAIVLFFGAPWPARVDAALYPIVQRLRAANALEPRAARRAAFGDAPLAALLPPLGLPAVAEAFGAGCLAILPFGQYAVGARLDVVALFMGGMATLAAAALLASRSPFRGLKAALHVVWQHVPAAAAVAGVVVVTGSLHVQEIARSQGGLPWEWLAFRGPASLLSFFVFASVLRVAAAPPYTATYPVLAHTFDPAADVTGAENARRGSWADGAARVHRLLVAGLAAALFLGGWSLPGVSSAEQVARPDLELAGAFVFLTKVGAIVVAAAWVRRLFPVRPLGEASRASTPWQLALSGAALACMAAWPVGSGIGAVQPHASLVLVVIATVGIAALALRVREALRSPAADGRASPFL
ncbi:MAG: NADH-quinone oxidoreductase subunit H, partial [Polyangiaceae bacterium]|nr:NADH-quinone oxidoreductase subunit H [Polyangiaceae bacterium]